jgi:receptor protein-tyrosine kinase
MSLIEKAAERLRQSRQNKTDEPAKAADAAAVPTARDDVPAADDTRPRPSATTDSGRERTDGPGKRARIRFDRLRADGISPHHEAHTQSAEEFRLIKRPILLNAFSRGPDKIRNGHLIMVSSARPGEGKTFCTLNLALSMTAERDLNVLLVDADVTKPDICARMGIETDRGLMDVLTDDNLDLSDVLIRTDLDNLSLLPAGQNHPLVTELLASERMERLVEEMASRYRDRVIIFDSPPVLMSSAPGVLALHMGQVLFVVEAEKTSQAAIESALTLLSGCDHISMLLNKTRGRGRSTKFGGRYGYYKVG